MRPSIKKTVILGLDPGVKKIGYGVVAFLNRQPVPLAYGTLSGRHQAEKNLPRLARAIIKIIRRFSVTDVAIERVFFGRNVRSALEVSEIRGLLVYLTQKERLRLVELGPQEIKSRLAGYGLADKQSLSQMVKLRLRLHDQRLAPDASDALAIALAALL